MNDGKSPECMCPVGREFVKQLNGNWLCVCGSNEEDVNGECKPVCAEGEVRDATSGDCVTPAPATCADNTDGKTLTLPNDKCVHPDK